MMSATDTGNVVDPTLIVGMKVLYLDEMREAIKDGIDPEALNAVIAAYKRLLNVNPVKMRDGRMAFLFLVDKEGNLWPTTGRFAAKDVLGERSED
jgi:hypothetical protein